MILGLVLRLRHSMEIAEDSSLETADFHGFGIGGIENEEKALKVCGKLEMRN